MKEEEKQEYWLAVDWQENILAKFKTEQECWDFMDKIDMSGSIRKEELKNKENKNE